MNLYLYAFNPHTATPLIATYVLKRYDIEIASTREAAKSAREQAEAIIDVLAKTPNDSENLSRLDLQTLAMVAAQQGYDNGKLEFLQSAQVQFWTNLPPDVLAQIPKPGGVA